MARRTLLPAVVALAWLCATGCGSGKKRAVDAGPTSRPSGLSEPVVIPSLQASCVPPTDWNPKPIERAKNTVHQVWVSPTGATAYGVIRFSLPLPVGPETVLWFFIREVDATEGDARLISKTRDDVLRGLRFVSESKKYRVRGNLVTKGFHGWISYAGTVQGRNIDADELRLAELARENTKTGIDENPSPAKP